MKKFMISNIINTLTHCCIAPTSGAASGTELLWL